MSSAVSHANRLFRILLSVLMTCGLMLTILPPAHAQLSVNLIAVNAAEDEVKEIEVRHDLPPELEPTDVLDTGELKLNYDVNKKTYYVSGKVVFQPKESKTFKIRIRDVWRIPPEEIQELKDQLDANLELLKNHENYPAARATRDQMIAQLDFIAAQQEKYSDNVNRRIEEYRAYREMLEKLRTHIYSLDFLKYESKAIQEIVDEKNTVTMVLEVTNPHEDTRTIVEKHFLPAEIREENIVDKLDFEVRYDEKAEKAYLTKQEEFKPGETKYYRIVIDDIWQFPVSKAENLLGRAEATLTELKESIYAKSSVRLFAAIEKDVGEIEDSENVTEELPVQEHIGLFRVNTHRYDEALKNYRRLEEMLAIVRAKKLEELEQKKVKNVLQRLKALRGLSALAEALFKKSISITVTWRIIMGAIIFVAVFTTIHFILWAKRSGRMGEELGPKSGEEGIKVVPRPGEEGAEEKKEGG